MEFEAQERRKFPPEKAIDIITRAHPHKSWKAGNPSDPEIFTQPSKLTQCTYSQLSGIDNLPGENQPMIAQFLHLSR